MAERGSVNGWPPVAYWMRVTAGILVVFALANMIVAIQQVLILILVSLVLAIGFQPAVTSLTARGLSRRLAVTTIGLSGFAVIGGFLALVLPTIVGELSELIASAPDYLRRAEEGSGFIAELNERFDLMDKLRSLGNEVPSTALSLIRSFTSFLFNTITVVILTLYFTSTMPQLTHATARLMRRDDRESFELILEESTRRVGGYLIGNLVISLIAGAVYFVFLLLVGVPYAAALAFWVALTDLIPTVGAFLGAGLVALVALIAGVPQFVIVLVFSLIYQQIENYVIGPRVMKQAIEMSAAAIIVAILIGGSLLGFVGALLALPLAAMIKITVRQLYLEDRIEEVQAEEERQVPPSPPPIVHVEQRRETVLTRVTKRVRARKR